MSGPDPKPAHKRRRRNIPAKEQIKVLLPAQGRQGRPPDPRLEDPCRCKICREAWAALWSTPQATAWGKTELYVASRWLHLLGEFIHGRGSLGTSSEMRSLEKQLVLTAQSMRLQGWRVEEESGEIEEPEDTEAKTRYGHLRVAGE